MHGTVTPSDGKSGAVDPAFIAAYVPLVLESAMGCFTSPSSEKRQLSPSRVQSRVGGGLHVVS